MEPKMQVYHFSETGQFAQYAVIHLPPFAAIGKKQATPES